MSKQKAAVDFIPLTIKQTTAVVHLTRGLHALIDVEDWSRIAAMGPWRAHPGGPRSKTFYAIRGRNYFPLHKAVTGKANVDHENRNGLDNRRANLREASQSLNVVNYGRRNKTGYRGVRRQRQGTFQASIQDDGLGTFATAEEAARAFDREAKNRYGEFAVLNFPDRIVTQDPDTLHAAAPALGARR